MDNAPDANPHHELVHLGIKPAAVASFETQAQAGAAQDAVANFATETDLTVRFAASRHGLKPQARCQEGGVRLRPIEEIADLSPEADGGERLAIAGEDVQGNLGLDEQGLASEERSVNGRLAGDSLSGWLGL